MKQFKRCYICNILRKGLGVFAVQSRRDDENAFVDLFFKKNLLSATETKYA
jgi:hypothetical protein